MKTHESTMRKADYGPDHRRGTVRWAHRQWLKEERGVGDTTTPPAGDTLHSLSLPTSWVPGVMLPRRNAGDACSASLGGDHWPIRIMPAAVDAETAGGKDVLIVEDEPYLCDLVADVLEAEGHHARKAANGLDALALVAEAPPQLILLDLMMPVMDGWEFMTALKANAAWQDIPVVIITAVYDVARTQRETGAKAIITKPFDIDQLAEVVKIFAS